MKTLSSTAVVLAIVAVCALSGCATKTYGRQGDLTSFEQTTMTCREIDLEEAKVQGFIQHVDQESSFSGRSVLSFMGDFGIGNTLEKSSALESADKRLKALQSAKKSRNCKPG